MNKIAVVYWSGSGNTEAMANAVVEGIKQSGAEAALFLVSDFSAESLPDYQAVIFGCPAMGAEELEPCEFAPVFDDCEGQLKGMTTGLFGSYGWGSGEWMDSWLKRITAAGADVLGTVIAQNFPDDDALTACRKLGADAAAAI